MDYTIPRKHDAPPRMLLWEFDQALIFMLAFMFAILANMFLLGVGGGYLITRWYQKRKAGKHRMYIFHLMYWHLPSEALMNIPALPPSSVREFIG